MATATEKTVQQQFTTSVIGYMDQLKANNLKTFGQRQTVSGGEKVTFYRYERGSAQKNIPSMYGANQPQEAKGGGKFKGFEASIEFVSSQYKLPEVDRLKTKLDIKSAIVRGMTEAVMLEEDDTILAKIKESDANLHTAGDENLDPQDIKCARALMAEIRDAYASAELTPDGKKGVAIVMNREDYKRITTSDAFINGDYKDAIKGGDGVLPLSINGAQIFLSNTTETGTIYIIPSNTFGFGEWENSVKTDATFVPTDGYSWHLQVVKSVGCKIIEPEFITKFKVKPQDEEKKRKKRQE